MYALFVLEMNDAGVIHKWRHTRRGGRRLRL